MPRTSLPAGSVFLHNKGNSFFIFFVITWFMKETAIGIPLAKSRLRRTCYELGAIIEKLENILNKSRYGI